MSVQFAYTNCPDGPSTITVVIPGKDPLVASSESHPNFDEIRENVLHPSASLVKIEELFDAAKTASKYFEPLSERVSVQYGRIYFDGDELDTSLTRHIVRLLKGEVKDWKPFVAFLEKEQINPRIESRQQLYGWLNGKDFSITEDGDIVGYKGVQRNDKGVYTSVNSGDAIVDGQAVSGKITNAIGSVVEMPRTQVTHDRNVACSTGLHVGTYDFARTFGRAAVLEVHVNPRDVVSVPRDHHEAKMRVCRYRVIGPVDKPHSEPIIKSLHPGGVTASGFKD